MTTSRSELFEIDENRVKQIGEVADIAIKFMSISKMRRIEAAAVAGFILGHAVLDENDDFQSMAVYVASEVSKEYVRQTRKKNG